MIDALGILAIVLAYVLQDVCMQCCLHCEAIAGGDFDRPFLDHLLTLIPAKTTMFVCAICNLNCTLHEHISP